MTRTGFGPRTVAAIDRFGPLCAGLDPTPALLRAWGLPDTAEGLRRFCGTVIEAWAGRVAAVKPQAAFFERHGSAGVAVLEEVLGDLASAGTLTVLDAKRGDIGSTMQAYAESCLADGAPLAADAVTLSPYLGYGSLRPAIDLARSTGRGVLVLALTSNPEGAVVQHAGTPPVAAAVAAAAAVDNPGWEPAGPVGLVVGATVGSAPADLGLDLDAVNGILLTPGVGAQGARPEDLGHTFGPAAHRVLAPVSRALLQEGPGVRALREAAERLGGQLAAGLGR